MEGAQPRSSWPQHHPDDNLLTTRWCNARSIAPTMIVRRAPPPSAKVAALVLELRKCYPQECWNACGLLIRIMVERTLDAVDAGVKAKMGLKDKINACRGVSTLSKTVREALDGLQGAKIMGDIAAHHSKIILDKPDVDLVFPAFRVLIKEVGSV